MIQLEQSTQILSIAKGRKRSLVSMWLPEKPEIGNQLLLWYSRINDFLFLKGDKGMLEFVAILSMIIDHIGFLWGILIF